jgi:hypothetical protein
MELCRESGRLVCPVRSGGAYCENLCFGNSVEAHFRWEAKADARRRGTEDSSDDKTLLELGRKAKAKTSSEGW